MGVCPIVVCPSILSMNTLRDQISYKCLTGSAECLAILQLTKRKQKPFRSSNTLHCA